jgi:hypothetical protein
MSRFGKTIKIIDIIKNICIIYNDKLDKQKKFKFRKNK